MKMLIEFYDKENIENILSLLTATYDRVVYFCTDDLNSVAYSVLYDYITRHFGISPEFVSIKDSTFKGIIDVFESVIKDGDETEVDITGGSEVFIAAIGYLTAQNTKNIKIHSFDIKNRTYIRHYPTTDKKEINPLLRVEDFITLCGGKIIGGTDRCRYSLRDSTIKNEVLRLWRAVKDIAKDWNRFSSVPTLKDGRQFAKLVEQKSESSIRRILSALKNNRIIDEPKAKYIGTKKYYTYRLNTPKTVDFLYDKAGNLLEMYAYIAAMECELFNDCCVGVPLDWDGKDSGTSNEIDLILTCGCIPVFVSCKNTAVENEYLYEINTMTHRFGGKYAKTMILSNHKNPHPIRERAKEMGIILIDNINNMSFEVFKERLIKYFT